MSDDSDFYVRPDKVGGLNLRSSFTFGRPSKLRAHRLDIHSLDTLSKITWDTKEIPFKAKLKLPVTTSSARLDSSEIGMTKNLWEHELCTGKLSLMVPCVNPVPTPNALVFYDVIDVLPTKIEDPERGVTLKAAVRVKDLLQTIWDYYWRNETDGELIDSVHELFETDRSALGGIAKDVVDKWTKSIIVPRGDLLGKATIFDGIVPTEDGQYFLNLKTT